MKALIFISLILAVFALFFPIVLSLSGQALDNPVVAASPSPNTVSSSTADSASETAPENLTQEDSAMNVRVLVGNEIKEMTMEQYLTGVVAAEMPVSFETEALKAQAIAARTYTLYKMLVSPSENHPDADVCNDPKCCKAYISEDALSEKWGANFDTNLSKISNAVASTDGVCITYDGEPALTVFHSSSSGATEDSANVWGKSLPYLHSVESPETDEQVVNFVSTVVVSLNDFKTTVLDSYPDAEFGDDVSQWITDLEYTNSNRISSIKVGGITISGPELRSLFNLRSTAIKISADFDAITFTTTGYGHGVGMSQYGANILAQEGYDYSEILAWYYDGTKLGKMDEFVNLN